MLSCIKAKEEYGCENKKIIENNKISKKEMIENGKQIAKKLNIELKIKAAIKNYKKSFKIKFYIIKEKSVFSDATIKYQFPILNKYEIIIDHELVCLGKYIFSEGYCVNLIPVTVFSETIKQISSRCFEFVISGWAE